MKSQIAYLRETRTFFYMDQQNKKVFIDFGNSLPINSDGSMSTSHYGDLYVALPKGEDPKLDCSDELMWIGSVDYKLPQWYRNTSGIQTFPVKGSFSTQEMTKLQNSPFLVVELPPPPPPVGTPYISHIGMCRPEGSVLAPFWREKGYGLCH